MKDFAAVKWIRKSCGNRDAEGVALVLLNALIGVCTTAFAVISKLVIDSAQNEDIDALKHNVLILLAAILIQITARIASSLLETVSQGKSEIYLKTKVFSKILNGNFAKINEYHSGELMTRLTADVSVVSENAVHIVPTAVLNIVRALSAAIALLSMDRRFALVFIACGIALSLATLILRGPIKKLHKNVQEKDGMLRSFMQESIENLFAVKVFRIEHKMIDRSKKNQKALFKAKVQRKSISIVSQIAFSCAFAAGFLAAVAYGANGVIKGTMTFGTLMSIVLLVNQLQTPISGITGIIPCFFSMVASSSRLMEICEQPEEPEEIENISYEDFLGVKARGLSFSYDEEPVITNTDFDINKGDFVCVSGRSGAGKTTLFKLFTGLYTPTTGELSVSTEKGQKNANVLRDLITFVPQDNMLFSGSVRENITLLNRDASDREINDALAVSCADEFVSSLPQGLETILGEDGSGVSQGQAQRLAIARAILSGKKIILMDEATASLDAVTEERFINNLKNTHGITVVFITHREKVLDSADKIIEL